jgi:ketosteroid isomerase-like protein
MDNISLARKVMTAESLQPMFDHLAEDVVLTVTIPPGTPLSGQFRGKPAVMSYFDRLGEIGEFSPFERPLEYFAAGSRVVVLGEERITVHRTGVTTSSAFAFVLDFRDSLITRLLMIEDTSAVAEAYRGRNGELTRAVPGGVAPSTA